MPGPVPPLFLPSVYSIVYEMQNIADPALKWRNTYDFHSPALPTPADPIFTALTNLQHSMTWSDSTLIEARVYNWAKGAPPYPTGLPIFTIPLHSPGGAPLAWSANAGDTAAGGEVVLRVDRAHGGVGKPGRLFYRSIPRAADIQAISGGKWSIPGGSPFQPSQFATIKTATGINNFFQGGSSTTGNLVVVQYSPKHQTVSGYAVISDLIFVGVTTNKQTRKNKK